MRESINIFGGYSKSHEVEANPQELMNLYVARTGANLSLLNTPGMSILDGIKITGDGGMRKLFVSASDPNKMHAVGGNVIYQVDASYNHSKGLELDTDEGYVGMIDSDTEIFIVDGASGYVFTKATNQYEKIISQDFTSSPADCTYLAGRFITFKKDSNEWFYSDIGNAKSWDLNNRYILGAGTYSDIIEAIEVLHGRLYIFGRKCTEVWYPQATSDNPFGIDRASLLEFGCVSRATLAKEENVIVWVATSGQQKVTSVVASNGGAPTEISNEGIVSELQALSHPEDSSAFIYTMNGSRFYQQNFTIDNKSFVYCFNSKTWSQLTAESFDRHRANTHAYFNQEHFVGDYSRLNIYNLSTSYTEDVLEKNETAAILRKVVSDRHYFNKGAGFCLDRLKIVGRQGIGKESGQDEIVYLECRISRSGGQCYGNTLSAQMGRLGRNPWRTDFFRLGTMDSIVMELKFYNKTNFALFSVVAYLSGFEE